MIEELIETFVCPKCGSTDIISEDIEWYDVDEIEHTDYLIKCKKCYYTIDYYELMDSKEEIIHRWNRGIEYTDDNYCDDE